MKSLDLTSSYSHVHDTAVKAWEVDKPNCHTQQAFSELCIMLLHWKSSNVTSLIIKIQ